MAKVVDADVPNHLSSNSKRHQAKSGATLTAEGRDFKTGSTGFYANGKIKNPKNRLPYQVGCNIIVGRQQRVI